MAGVNPSYGYKWNALMCRAGSIVQDSEAYGTMKDYGVLQNRKPRRTEVHQAAKLFELLPQGPNDLWQMDDLPSHSEPRPVVRGDGDRLLLSVLARLLPLSEFQRG